MNKTLAVLLLCGMGVFLIALVFDNPGTEEVASGFYSIAGLAWLIFGNWLAVRILMEKN